jgi:hypothetical protein
MDIRKIIIILVIGALFAFFVAALAEAIHESPDYDDYCEEFEKPYQVEQEDFDDAAWKACRQEYDSAMEEHSLYVFYVSIIFGLIAIVVGLMLPSHKDDLNQWIGSGFMLGGFFTLFYGTIRAYSHLDRILRPIVLLIELLIIIYVSYKKIGKK